jgi:tetratricopeptide (TPR) repeat protein
MAVDKINWDRIQLVPRNPEKIMIAPQNQKKILAAQGYLEIGMLEDSLRELETLPDNEQMINESLSVYLEIYREAGDWDRMENIALLLCESDKKNVQSWLDCAFARYHLDSVESARATLLAATKRFPNEALVLFQLACCECQLGDIAEAKKHLNQSKELCPICRVLALTDEGDLDLIWQNYSTPILQMSSLCNS